MHPAFLDNMSWEIAEVYGAITDQILINLARYFPFYDAGDPLPSSAFAYQAKMLAQMGQVSKETVQIIRNGLADADLALQGVLEQAIIDAVKTAEPELLDGVRKGVITPETIPAVLAPNQMRAFNLYYKQSADKLNLVNTVMLESTKSAYQQTVADVVAGIDLADRLNRTQIALDTAAGETLTGVSSWNQALRHAIDRLKEGGITGFVDHAGRHWSAEGYVAMDIRTTVFNTGRAATWETNQNFGNDLYLVSYHNGARPLCYPWQNKVISSTDNARTVYDLDGNPIQVIAQSDTSYGEAAGLFGINCKHYPTPFIPGVSVADGKPQDEEENAKTYAESQEQRRLERKLREQKRDILMAKAQGADDEEITRLREKARNTSKDIDEFCKETGRARHRDREAVYTKREFPDKERYDVSKFERQQKEMIDKYFADGGAQQGYTFGEMTPSEPIIPATPAPVESAPIAPNPVVSTFNPAKTREEAEAYARERFANSVNYKGLSLDNANKINETLTELQEKYPTAKLETLAQRPQGSVARARYNNLEINGRKLGKVLDEGAETFTANQKIISEEIEMIEKRYEGKAKIPWDAQNKIDKLKEKLRFVRYGVDDSYTDHVRVVVAHEYGHILSDQYFGMINNERANPNYTTNWGLRDMYAKWRAAHEKAIQTGDIYKLSEYSSKNPKEFFAESFAAMFMGETLPDYVQILMDEVLKNGVM